MPLSNPSRHSSRSPTNIVRPPDAHKPPSSPVASHASVHSAKASESPKQNQNDGPQDFRLVDEGPTPLRFEPSRERFGKGDPLWKHYTEVAMEEDKQSIRTWNAEFDSLPIFAGLFASVLTAFIIEVYKDLKPDTEELILAAIQQGLASLNGSSPTSTLHLLDAQGSTFEPTARAVRVNGCFFVALAFALMSAAGSMLSKVWCSEYSRRPIIGSPHEQALRRQWHYNGLLKFRYQDILDFLPVLLYSSIMMFMVGLCDFVYGIHQRIALYLILTFTFSFVFAATLTFSSLILPEHFPYRVPLANVIIRNTSVILKYAKKKSATVTFRYRQGINKAMYSQFLRKDVLSAVYTILICVLKLPWNICLSLWATIRYCAAVPTRCNDFREQATEAFTYTDSFDLAVKTMPVDDAYCKLEVEAMGWLIQYSNDEEKVNELLKNIPTTVSTFKHRRKVFIKNGAVDRLCTLFEDTFDKDWEGPYPGISISYDRKKRYDMLDYGYAIYALCSPRTLSGRLENEVICLEASDSLSHQILGFALRTCQDNNFFVEQNILQYLVKEVDRQVPPIPEDELEMVLGLVLRSVITRRVDSSITCSLVCTLMRARPITSQTAALFCLIIHHRMFNREQALSHDYNPALCSYHLSYQCISYVDRLPTAEAEQYSFVFMQIIQCLCNNESQLELHDKAQLAYASFTCNAMLREHVAWDILREGVVTLVALSNKFYWEHQNGQEILLACQAAASHPECTTGILRQSLSILQMLPNLVVTKDAKSTNIAKAAVFFLKEEMKHCKTAVDDITNAIHRQVSSIIHAAIADTFILETNASDPAATTITTFFRYPQFPAFDSAVLLPCSMLMSNGLADLQLAELLSHIENLELSGRSHEYVFAIVHLFCLSPKTIPVLIDDYATMRKINELARDARLSPYTRQMAGFIGLLIWSRLNEKSLSWSSAEQQEREEEFSAIGLNAIPVMEDLLRSLSSSPETQDHLLWNIFNWIGCLEKWAERHPIGSSQSTTLTMIKDIVDGIMSSEPQKELTWKDKLGPTKCVVTLIGLQQRLAALETKANESRVT